MARRKEVPFDPVGEFIPAGTRYGGNTPETEYEALQQAAPFAEIEWSKERLLPLRDLIQDMIEIELDEREQWIFNACVIEKRSLRKVAEDLQLAKSYVDRIKQQAVVKLREALEGEPLIEAWLNRCVAG